MSTSIEKWLASHEMLLAIGSIEQNRAANEGGREGVDIMACAQ